MLRSGLAVLCIALGLAGAASAAEDDARSLSGSEVKRRWHGRLDGLHFTASVRLEMNLAGVKERRELLVWRDDRETEERVLVRFEEPPDLRNVGLLYLENDGRPNDYFLYQPSTRRVRRLPESVASDDVYGIDLEFLGFGVAQTEPTEIEQMTMETLGGLPVYRLVERALEKNPRFDLRTTWIDPETFVPRKTEHRRGGRLVLVAETLEVSAVQDVPTPLRISFHSLEAQRDVELVVQNVDYRAPIPEDYFSIMALVRARTEH
jgi:hypothetical protein